MLRQPFTKVFVFSVTVLEPQKKVLPVHSIFWLDILAPPCPQGSFHNTPSSPSPPPPPPPPQTVPQCPVLRVAKSQRLEKSIFSRTMKSYTRAGVCSTTSCPRSFDSCILTTEETRAAEEEQAECKRNSGNKFKLAGTATWKYMPPTSNQYQWQPTPVLSWNEF